MGSHVWVEDPVLAWLDGEVTRINGQEVHVKTTNGKTVSAPLLGYFCMNGPVPWIYHFCMQMELYRTFVTCDINEHYRFCMYLSFFLKIFYLVFGFDKLLEFSKWWEFQVYRFNFALFGSVDLEIKKLDSFSSYNDDCTITTLHTNATAATTTTTATAVIIIVNVVVKRGNQEMYVSSCIWGQLVLKAEFRTFLLLNLHSISNALFIHHSAIP